MKLYKNAVKDAETAEPAEISKNLIAIASYDSALVWKSLDGKNHVLMLTWTGWDGYDDKTSKSVALQREVWVTTVPELKNFCEIITDSVAVLTLRLEQLLGLPPHNGKTRFVEMWAKPEDLFRPSPDPGISDHEAEIAFPVSDRFIKVDSSYIKWFKDTKSKSYGDDGYPWTRLGYTFDWGNPKSEIGLSEFVIREGAEVYINSVENIEEYCRQ